MVLSSGISRGSFSGRPLGPRSKMRGPRAAHTGVGGSASTSSSGGQGGSIGGQGGGGWLDAQSVQHGFQVIVSVGSVYGLIRAIQAPLEQRMDGNKASLENCMKDHKASVEKRLDELRADIKDLTNRLMQPSQTKGE